MQSSNGEAGERQGKNIANMVRLKERYLNKLFMPKN